MGKLLNYKKYLETIERFEKRLKAGDREELKRYLEIKKEETVLLMKEIELEEEWEILANKNIEFYKGIEGELKKKNSEEKE